MLHRACSSTALKGRHITFTPSIGTYSIDDFNAKVKVVVSQQKQGWEIPQITELTL